jgi:hypothetical protein
MVFSLQAQSGQSLTLIWINKMFPNLEFFMYFAGLRPRSDEMSQLRRTSVGASGGWNRGIMAVWWVRIGRALINPKSGNPMKSMLALAAITLLSLPAAPVLALSSAQGLIQPEAIQPVERKSGRCPGGEPRPFVPGCSGV